ncbi:MAG TPA: DNA polymerase IV, partial [Thermoplasmata archaeon]|nr:DNA polymerase IV [Thermoplasmata archaeon]
QLEQDGLVYRTVNVKVRFEDFETHTAAKSLKVHTRDKEPIVEQSRVLLRPFLEDGRKIRLLGVRLSNLKYEKPKAVSLSRFS